MSKRPRPDRTPSSPAERNARLYLHALRGLTEALPILFALRAEAAGCLSPDQRAEVQTLWQQILGYLPALERAARDEDDA